MKVSWTILNAWASGKRDEALKIMSGIELPATPAMENGKRLHGIVAEKKLKLIPDISDKAIFENIVPEKHKWQNYFKVRLNDWLELSLVIDVLDKENKMIVDWKASTLRSSEHSKMQIYLYALAMQKEGTEIKKGIYGTIREFGEGVVCTDYSMFKINGEKLELALNYAETIGGEIRDFLNN